MAEDGATSLADNFVVVNAKFASPAFARAEFRAPPLHSVHGRREGAAKFRINRVAPVGGRAKRFVDFSLALLVLTVIAPLLLIVAIAVRLDSRGPSLFKQERSGFRGRPFRIYKFRTMTVQERGGDVVSAQRGDARITRLGAFLRKSSIDELPQLFNVLRGEMSFIGPRPHALAHDSKFTKACPDYPKRFAARPGISGLAQVSGSRGSIDSDEALFRRVRFDLDYVSRWSLLMDVSIVWRTVVHIARNDEAY